MPKISEFDPEMREFVQDFSKALVAKYPDPVDQLAALEGTVITLLFLIGVEDPSLIAKTMNTICSRAVEAMENHRALTQSTETMN